MNTSLFDIQQFCQNRMLVIAGPCAVETEETTLEIAQELKRIAAELDLPIVFKASYRKANRTSGNSFSGIGDESAIDILRKVKRDTGLPILTDIHAVEEIDLLQEVIDIIQIPAFLCRQTDLIQAAALTGKPVNIKKGQFASAEIMRYAAEKVSAKGNNQVLLTERGSFFGYEDLVVDMRNIPLMQSFNVPVIYDATHSVQQPGKGNGSSGGLKEMILPLADAAMAAGADGIFIETHPSPENALSDASSMLPLKELPYFLSRMNKWWKMRREMS